MSWGRRNALCLSLNHDVWGHRVGNYWLSVKYRRHGVGVESVRIRPYYPDRDGRLKPNISISVEEVERMRAIADLCRDPDYVRMFKKSVYREILRIQGGWSSLPRSVWCWMW